MIGLIVRPEAEADLSNTYRWYEECGAGLGRRFLSSVDVCLKLVQRYPLLYECVHKNVRRAFLKRFPYGIFYVVHRESVVVLACFHFKRDPQQILNRLQ